MSDDQEKRLNRSQEKRLNVAQEKVLRDPADSPASAEPDESNKADEAGDSSTR